MKALVVTPYYAPKIGGLENYARQLNIALREYQHWDITVITSGEGLRLRQDTVDNLSVYRLGTWFKISNTPFNPLWPFILRRIIRTEKPDVILAHTPVPSLADAVAFAKGKTPLIVINHAATLIKHGAPLFNLFARVYILLSAYTFKSATRIFAVSPFVRSQLPQRLQSKTVVVPNAVWHREIMPRQQPEGANFIFVASLDKSHGWKGLNYILHAIAWYRDQFGPDVHVTIVGDGTMRREYENLVHDLKITEQVEFTGALTGDAKLDAIRQATAMIVYPSTENDAFPTVILEAWALHVPVIAADIGALPTIVTHQETGYVCAPKQPIALAKLMRDVVTAPVSRRAHIAHAAAVLVRARYTWERQADSVQQIVGGIV